MKSDIEIARRIELKKIKQVAESVDIPRDEVENYGRYIAKIPTHLIDCLLYTSVTSIFPIGCYIFTKAVNGTLPFSI